MSEVTINNSPVHSDSIITRAYGIVDSSYSCGWHTGVDFAPYGQTETNPILYSVKLGTVVYVNNTDNVALGVQCQIQDDDGAYWRYCHMALNSLQVQVGDRVNINTPIGRMGATGNVTGIHLHLEKSTTLAWQCSTFLNPCTELNIPNETGTIVKWKEIIPPTPTLIKKNKFKWVLYTNKFRKRRNF